MANISREELDRLIEQLSTDIGLTRKWVQGLENETVPLGDPGPPVQTPTIRNLVANFKNIQFESLAGFFPPSGGFSHADSKFFVDFSQMPTDVFENMLKELRIPIWLERNTNFYVRSDGSDSNTGRQDSASGAFKTIQYALNFITSNYNLSTYNIYLYVRAGSYSSFNLPKYSTNTGRIIIIGAGKNQTVINSSSGTIISSSASAGRYLILGFGFSSSRSINSSNSMIVLGSTGADVEISGCSFNWTQPSGTVGGSSSIFSVGNGSSLSFVLSSQGGMPAEINELSIDQQSTTLIPNFILSTGGQVNIYTNIMFSGNVVSGSLITTARCIDGGSIRVISSATSGIPIMQGTSVGSRFSISLNGTINTGGQGENYFPGTLDGTKQSGGQYE